LPLYELSAAMGDALGPTPAGPGGFPLERRVGPFLARDRQQVRRDLADPPTAGSVESSSSSSSSSS
jgi:hypothetical protein